MANLGRLAIAMLGILAYQNRDKLGEMIRGVGRGTDPNNPQGGLLDQVSKGVSGTALGDMLDWFAMPGRGLSWVAGQLDWLHKTIAEETKRSEEDVVRYS